MKYINKLIKPSSIKQISFNKNYLKQIINTKVKQRKEVKGGTRYYDNDNVIFIKNDNDDANDANE